MKKLVEIGLLQFLVSSTCFAGPPSQTFILAECGGKLEARVTQTFLAGRKIQNSEPCSMIEIGKNIYSFQSPSSGWFELVGGRALQVHRGKEVEVNFHSSHLGFIDRQSSSLNEFETITSNQCGLELFFMREVSFSFHGVSRCKRLTIESEGVRFQYSELGDPFHTRFKEGALVTLRSDSGEFLDTVEVNFRCFEQAKKAVDESNLSTTKLLYQGEVQNHVFYRITKKVPGGRKLTFQMELDKANCQLAGIRSI